MLAAPVQVVGVATRSRESNGPFQADESLRPVEVIVRLSILGSGAVMAQRLMNPKGTSGWKASTCLQYTTRESTMLFGW